MEMRQIINKLHVLDLVKCLTTLCLYPFYTGIYLIKLTGVNLLSSNLLVTFVTEIKYLLPRDCDIDFSLIGCKVFGSLVYSVVNIFIIKWMILAEPSKKIL